MVTGRVPVRLGARAALAAIAGATLPLAFAPFGLWPVVPLSFAVLLLLLDGLEPAHAGFAGWCYGLGMFGCGVWWIQVSVHQFGVPYYAFSVSVTALFIAGMALYPALFATVLARTGRSAGALRLLALAPGLWVLTELLRARLFTGFPWLAFGYAQIDGPLAGYAPLVGVFGVSLAAAWTGGALAACRGAGLPRAAVIVTAIVSVLAGGAMLGGRAWTEPAGPPLEAALVQGAVPQAVKWRRELREPTIALYSELSRPHWDADVLLWPETAIPAFPHEVPDALAALEQTARSHGTDLLIGMPAREPGSDGYYNSLVDLGDTPGRYDKRHLVPFGEFFPLGEVLRNVSRMLSIPMSDFSRGAPDQALLEVAGYRAGASICYEDAFPGEVAGALPAAAFLVNVSNDAWFGDTIAPHQHLEIARMRSLETGRWMLRGTNTGVTAIIDARGRVTTRSPQFVEAALRGAFVPMRGATLYVRFGDTPVWLLASGLVFAGFLAGVARRESEQPGA